MSKNQLDAMALLQRAIMPIQSLVILASLLSLAMIGGVL